MSFDLYNPQLQQLIAMQYPNDIPPHITRLHLMENPYPLPEDIKAIIQQKLKNLPLHRYPNVKMDSLKQKLRATFNIPDGSEIILGNGSFELLQNIFIALHHPEYCFLTTSPGFFFFQRCAKLFNQKIITIPLEKNHFDLDLAAMLSAIQKEQPNLIIIDNPNNPMASVFHPRTLQRIIEAAPGLVLIDEAYGQYAKHSMIPYLSQYPNLLITRSFSKLGVAGIRFGFLCCHPTTAKQINKTMLPFNLNTISATIAEVILDHFSTLETQIQQIIADRDLLIKKITVILNDPILPSATNFINFKIPHYDAETVFKQFIKQDILLFFYRTKPSHPLYNHLRVTVGNNKENLCFLNALQHIVELK